VAQLRGLRLPHLTVALELASTIPDSAAIAL